MSNKGVSEEDQKKFINSIYKNAQEVQRKTGIFASITIAQAIEESKWGTSNGAINKNNLFGIMESGAIKSFTTISDCFNYRVDMFKKHKFTSTVYKKATMGETVEEVVYCLQNTGIKNNEGIDVAYCSRLDSSCVGYESRIMKIINQYNLKKYDLIKFLVSTKSIQEITRIKVEYDYMNALNYYLKEFKINSKEEISLFLSFCVIYNEDKTLKSSLNNLNLTINQLRNRYFGFKISYEKIKQYINNPKKLALHLYSGGKGIVDENSAWKYRPSGYIPISYGNEDYTYLSKLSNDSKVLKDGAEYVDKNYVWLATFHTWNKIVSKAKQEDMNKPIDFIYKYVVNKTNRSDVEKTYNRIKKIITLDKMIKI